MSLAETSVRRTGSRPVLSAPDRTNIVEEVVQYVLLLANAPDAWDVAPADDQTHASDGESSADDGVIDDWVVYTRALHEAGVLVSGAALHDPHSATSVRIRNGRRVLTDGPFSETKEHLIGYYVIDVANLDAAIHWAARVPNIRTGTVEVRPVVPGLDSETVLSQPA